jgi:hypothetical protein
LCFHFAGAKSVLTLDIYRHLDDTVVWGALKSLEPHLDTIARWGKRGNGTVRDIYRALRNTSSVDDMLTRAGITYRAGFDTGRIGTAPARSLDIVYTNNVLEHVPEPEIKVIARGISSALRPGGLSLHAVACNDHYAHFDKAISFINYLQYSDKEWARWDNGVLWQNRFRAPDFVDMCATEAAPVIYSKQYVRPGTVEALQTMTIDPRFQRYSLEDLAATTVRLVSRAV